MSDIVSQRKSQMLEVDRLYEKYKKSKNAKDGIQNVRNLIRELTFLELTMKKELNSVTRNTLQNFNKQ